MSFIISILLLAFVVCSHGYEVVNGKSNIITCKSNEDCDISPESNIKDYIIHCPYNGKCTLNCVNENQCENITVHGNDSLSLNINCDNKKSCINSKFYLPNNGIHRPRKPSNIYVGHAYFTSIIHISGEESCKNCHFYGNTNTQPWFEPKRKLQCQGYKACENTRFDCGKGATCGVICGLGFPIYNDDRSESCKNIIINGKESNDLFIRVNEKYKHVINNGIIYCPDKINAEKKDNCKLNFPKTSSNMNTNDNDLEIYSRNGLLGLYLYCNDNKHDNICWNKLSLNYGFNNYECKCDIINMNFDNRNPDYECEKIDDNCQYNDKKLSEYSDINNIYTMISMEEEISKILELLWNELSERKELYISSMVFIVVVLIFFVCFKCKNKNNTPKAIKHADVERNNDDDSDESKHLMDR